MKKFIIEHTSMELDSIYHHSYGVGWTIVDLPAPIGAIGKNGMFVDEMPVLGRATTEKKL
jgi:hypothetical protein